jgi:hypothetical protein
VSAGVDLATGLFLLAAGGLLATGRLHGRRKASVPAGDLQPEKPQKKDGWAQRVLSEPRPGLAMHSQDWLLSHALQLIACTALILGAYLTASALVRLS